MCHNFQQVWLKDSPHKDWAKIRIKEEVGFGFCWNNTLMLWTDDSWNKFIRRNVSLCSWWLVDNWLSVVIITWDALCSLSVVSWGAVELLSIRWSVSFNINISWNEALRLSSNNYSTRFRNPQICVIWINQHTFSTQDVQLWHDMQRVYYTFA